MTWAALLLAVLFVVVVIGVLWFVAKVLFSVDNGFNDRKICQFTVTGHDVTTAQVAGQTVTPDIIKIDCKRRLVTIGQDHVEVNGKKAAFYDGLDKKYVSTYEAPTQEIAYGVMADELAGCWWQFLEGKKDFLGYYGTGNPVTEDHRQCFICSEIRLDPKATPPTQTTPFINYTHLATVRPEYVNKTVSLYDYILNGDTICNKYLYGDFNKSNLCIENYFSINSEQSGYFKDSFLTAALNPGLHEALKAGGLITPSGYIDTNRLSLGGLSKDPAFDRNPTLQPGKTYEILFVREGGSWFKTHSRQLYNSVLSLLGINGSGATIDTQSSTYFVWVQDQDKVNSDTCDEYFG